MRVLTNRDFLAGLVCLILSIFVLWQAQDYSLGTLRNMGPGYLPRFLGFSLGALGILIMAFSTRTATKFPKINVRALVFITIGIVIFAFLMNPAGLFISTIALVFLCGLSEKRFMPLRLSLLSLALCLMSYLIFILGLNMPIRLFPWSF